MTQELVEELEMWKNHTIQWKDIATKLEKENARLVGILENETYQGSLAETLWKAEEYDCAQMVLNDLGVPVEKDGLSLSLVGRVKALLQKPETKQGIWISGRMVLWSRKVPVSALVKYMIPPATEEQRNAAIDLIESNAGQVIVIGERHLKLEVGTLTDVGRGSINGIRLEKLSNLVVVWNIPAGVEDPVVTVAALKDRYGDLTAGLEDYEPCSVDSTITDIG